jgi:hypothetical protein
MIRNNTPTIYTAAASSSLSLAIVGIARWFLTYVHVNLPPDVEGDFIVIITSIVHWFLTKEPHIKTTPITTPIAVEPAPETPTP